MLSSIIRSIYIDPKWVAEEYFLCSGRQKKWKTLDDEEALKCWNLELEIEAELDNEAYALELTTLLTPRRPGDALGMLFVFSKRQNQSKSIKISKSV